jgi:hypothetical protein
MDISFVLNHYFHYFLLCNFVILRHIDCLASDFRISVIFLPFHPSAFKTKLTDNGHSTQIILSGLLIFSTFFQANILSLKK